MRGLKAEMERKRAAAVESKVGGGEPSDSRSEGLNDEGIQTDGTLVLIKGLTITLHMRDGSSDDLVMRADLSGEGVGVDR
jgi:hypothetical protein